MQGQGILLLLTALSLDIVCSEQLHYTPSGTCENDHTCEYDYSMVINNFNRDRKDPVNLTATVQIFCESSGSFGSVAATRYCMTVTQVGGNFFSIGQNESSETDESATRQYVLENYLSGWFCFAQSSDGQVMSVFHSRGEDTEIVNFKKGIAAAFQANFKGSEEEIETDPQSSHMAHYSYMNTTEGTSKMHRTITSEDVIEYPMNVPSKDVQLVKEEDVEYKDGQLVRSSGTTILSLDQKTPDVHDNNDTDVFDIFTVTGSFSMERKVCRLVPRAARKRRSVLQRKLESESSSEESLLASFDESKAEIVDAPNIPLILVFRRICQQLNREVIIAAIKDVNDTNAYQLIEKGMVLDRKYGPVEGCIPITNVVLNYLTEIKSLGSEEYILQRVMIYSLLSAAGGLNSQHALIESYNSEMITEAERNSLILAIASLPDPSQEFIRQLEGMIEKSSETTILLLAYGALVENAAPDMEIEMVAFLADRIPKEAVDNQEVLIHVIHALGNTKSPRAIQYITQYMEHSDEDVRLTVVTALRFFTHMPSVQQLLLRTLLDDPSEALVSVVIDALGDGYETNKEAALNEELILLLTNLTISFGNFDLKKELVQYLKLVGTADTLALAHTLEIDGFESRQKRGTSYWPSTSPSYNAISSYSSRQNDVDTFPTHRAYLWSKSLGKTTGSLRAYLQAAAGLFAGINNNCDFKLFGKAVLRGHILGRERDFVTVEGSFKKLNGQVNGKFYGKIGSWVLFNYDSSISIYFSNSYSLGQYKTRIFSFDYPIFVYIVTLDLSVSVHMSMSGTLDIAVGPRSSGGISGTMSITPLATLYVDGSVSVGLVIYRVGISLAVSIPYKVSVGSTSTLCNCTTSLQFKVCGFAYDEWPGSELTLSAFYQRRRLSWRGGWKNRVTWAPLTYTWTLSSSNGPNYYYNTCNGNANC